MFMQRTNLHVLGSVIPRCEITELSSLLFSLCLGLPKDHYIKTNVAVFNSINLNRCEKQCYYGDIMEIAPLHCSITAF